MGETEVGLNMEIDYPCFFSLLRNNSHEIVRIELVIPVRLIIGFLHAERIVVNAFVVPLASFIEEEHLFGD